MNVAIRRIMQERAKAEELAGAVRERRVALRVSQAYLASAAGCSLSTVRTMEAGPPSLDMAARIDAVLTDLEGQVAR